jgi:hypothetical protein
MCLRTLIWKRSKQKLEKELWEARLLWGDSEGGKYIFISSDIWLLISSSYLQWLLHPHIYLLGIWVDGLDNPSTVPKDVPPSEIVFSLSRNTFFKFLFCVSIRFLSEQLDCNHTPHFNTVIMEKCIWSYVFSINITILRSTYNVSSGVDCILAFENYWSLNVMCVYLFYVLFLRFQSYR